MNTLSFYISWLILTLFVFILLYPICLELSLKNQFMCHWCTSVLIGYFLNQINRISVILVKKL